MELKSLELKVCYCKDLKAFNFFQKLTLYANVSIVSDDPKKKLNEKQQHQQQRTQTDRDADRDGGNPEWYHEMRFDLGWVPLHNCDHLFLHFEFRHDGLVLGDKLIGETRVPLKDLIQEADCAGIVRFVNYEVRTGDGKPNGLVNFSYKVNCNGIIANQSGEILEGKITGYPVAAPETGLVQYNDAPDHYQDWNQSQIQYPITEIDSSTCAISYPPVAIPVNSTEEGYPSPSTFAPPPPIVSSPSSSGYNYYYPSPFSPPPLMVAPPFGSLPPPPPPPPYFFPPPPPPPMMSGAQYYPPPDPNFQRVPRW